VLLFGTDVGYMSDSSTEGELAALAHAGLGPSDVLRMLTTAPAARFGVGGETGTVAPGKRADLVLLSADPSHDVAAFARVAATVRAGRVVYSAQPTALSAAPR
jgi:imidazolonepropionase-like amidohydrolase